MKMILTIPNFGTKNKSGSKISSSTNDIMQNITSIFRHRLRGLQIVYSCLRVMKPVKATTIKRYDSKSLLKIVQNIIIINIFNTTVMPLGKAFLNTLDMKPLVTLL